MPEDGSLKEFQEYYENTKWYWANAENFPSTISGYKPMQGRQGPQRILVPDNNEQWYLVYTELKHQAGVKSFHGTRTLKAIENVNEPLFGIMGDTDSFVGFLNSRMFYIRVEGEYPDQAVQDAITIGLKILSANGEPQETGTIEPGVATSATLPDQGTLDTMIKVEIDLSTLNKEGLRGPPDGKVAVSYEFTIPNTERYKEEVLGIDPSVVFMPGSRGRIGATEDECLCIGSTHDQDYQTILRSLSELPYIDRIIESYFE